MENGDCMRAGMAVQQITKLVLLKVEYDARIGGDDRSSLLGICALTTGF